MQICSRLLGNQEIRLSRPQVFPLGDVSSQSSCCHMPIIFDDILSRLRWTEAYVSNTCKPSKARPDPQTSALSVCTFKLHAVHSEAGPPRILSRGSIELMHLDRWVYRTSYYPPSSPFPGARTTPLEGSASSQDQ